MKYIWILSRDSDATLAVYSQPGIALTALERAYGVGQVKVLSRSDRNWRLELWGKVRFDCTRRLVQTSP